MRGENKLQVCYQDYTVGILAQTENKKIAFAYSEEWLKNGFAISPFSLPLEKKVFVPTKYWFDGLFGVFADSLPDAWGNILLNRVLKKEGIDIGQVNTLDRLAIVGNSGMGALTYHPAKEFTLVDTELDLDELAKLCSRILNAEEVQNLDELYLLGGTSGGARPKIMTHLDKEDWIIKFPTYSDGKDIGKMEFEYAECAKSCGICMPETRLLSSDICPGYFAVKRFDRIGKVDQGSQKRIHMLTVAAILELDFRQPNLDYHTLMKLTKVLTRNNKGELEEMYRRMCFNIYAHNRDDHSKNFSFLYDELTDSWSLSPAYDLTYSNTYYGEHTTTVDGNGRTPGMKELVSVGVQAGLKKSWCEQISKEIAQCVQDRLDFWLK